MENQMQNPGTREPLTDCPQAPTAPTESTLPSTEAGDEGTPTDSAATVPSGGEHSSLEEELTKSRSEIQRLSSLLLERDRKDREASAFARFFPGLTADDIPDSVRKAAEEHSLPLIAVYALYARESELTAQRAADADRRASLLSSGPVSGDREEDFFTLDQIRAMSPKEVRKNYKAVLKSIGKSKSFK